MGFGRTPGAWGRQNQLGCTFFPGPLGQHGWFSENPHVRTSKPVGTGRPSGKAPARAATKSDDEKELELLHKTFGIIKNKSGSVSFVTRGKKGVFIYHVKKYVAARDAHFGSTADFKTYLATSKAELDADKEKLRYYVEPPKKVRNKVSDWRKAQDVFYAWVRKSYENKLGVGTDVPKLIKAQMSATLKAKLKQVKVDYGKSFKYGGFNPRPMKMNGYRFGSLSDHALGTAIDIEASKNAHITVVQWKLILSFTGKTSTTSARQSNWKKKPKTLYDEIDAIDAEFVKKLKTTIDAEKKKAAAATPAATPAPAVAAKTPTDIDRAMAANADLKKLGKNFLTTWQKGFFDLPWDLVEELHQEGFTWGASFSHPDIHHFEL